MLLKDDYAIRSRFLTRLSVDGYRALLGLLQARYQIQKRRFAAARRTQQGNKFPFLNRKRYIINGGKRTTRSLMKRLADTCDFDQ